MAEEILRTLTEKVDPRHAALLIVDVQNDFCAVDGFFHRIGREMSMIQATVPGLAKFLEEARQVGLPVIFIQAIYDEAYLSGPMKEMSERRGIRESLCLSGTWGADFYVIRPLPHELVVQKHRYSAFAGTELDLILRNSGVKTIIVCGVSTNICVESTARDGYFLNYYIVLVSDCSASNSESLHRATLENIQNNFGVTATAEEIIGAWTIR